VSVMALASLSRSPALSATVPPARPGVRRRA
jgi:hypothetical protein